MFLFTINLNVKVLLRISDCNARTRNLPQIIDRNAYNFVWILQKISKPDPEKPADVR